MRAERVTFQSGELALKGIVSLPEGGGPFPAVVVCHPHPLYGGSMHNNVVNAVCEALTAASFVSFKFNLRGVGSSEGHFSYGTGEQQDVASAVSYLVSLSEVDGERIGLAGYSAGAGFAAPVACSDERLKAIAAISPPLAMFDFECLKTCGRPLFLICGGMDDFTPIARFIEFCRGCHEPREYEHIEGADHFWWGHEPQLAKRVTDFFTRHLQQA